VPLNSIFTGNILTVADDLLKNDGQKFLEMMEQLAERRMQREQQAAQDLEVDSDADHGEEGDDDDEEDDEEDDDEEDEEEEEVCYAPLSLCSISNLRRRSLRIKRWRRANACFPFSPHACSSNECSRRTAKRLRRSVKCSCFASLRTRTKRPRIARCEEQKKIRKRRTNGGPYLSYLLVVSFLFDGS
jgi:hypothetical protein